VSKRIAELVNESDHRTLAIWAANCAERALPFFEIKKPKDIWQKKAIEAGRERASTGISKMA
jgi:hypothetical protein